MLRTVGLPLVIALALGGCHPPSSRERTLGDCEGISCKPCPPAITVRVAGAPGSPAPSAVLVGIDGTCGTGGTTVCLPRVHAPGDYTFEVHAVGYKPASVRGTVPEALEEGTCCVCPYEPQVVDVTLERE